jgi:hypothetical protein
VLSLFYKQQSHTLWSHKKYIWYLQGASKTPDTTRIAIYETKHSLNIEEKEMGLCKNNEKCLPYILKRLFLMVFLFFYYCCAEWGYIVAFIKVLTMYQIYHTWIHPLHRSPLLPSPPIPGTVSTGIIFAFTDMCTCFLHHSHPPFPTTSPLPLMSTSPKQDMFHPPILLFCRRKKKNNDFFACLR